MLSKFGPIDSQLRPQICQIRTIGVEQGEQNMLGLDLIDAVLLGFVPGQLQTLFGVFAVDDLALPSGRALRLTFGHFTNDFARLFKGDASRRQDACVEAAALF